MSAFLSSGENEAAKLAKEFALTGAGLFVFDRFISPSLLSPSDSEFVHLMKKTMTAVAINESVKKLQEMGALPTFLT